MPNTTLDEDKATLLKIWLAMGGDKITLTNNTEDVSKWKGITVEIGRVTVIDSKMCNLSGVIPKEIGDLTSLIKINFYGNQLSGGIPKEIGNLTNLSILWLSYNQLSGIIPKEMGNLRSMTDLSFSANKLEGEIPSELKNCKKMIELSFRDNLHTGEVP
ncbi:hypothetical protein TrST_g8792 [Triparma strigata]|uniref:Uncharacterized protein n=1 Tax=Triparma strigata TaxID=1606541 RepID=A0A9W7CA81_9STRA|nr:hypothetical protein TrST_g8792 [Triparma strigata]